MPSLVSSTYLSGVPSGRVMPSGVTLACDTSLPVVTAPGPFISSGLSNNISFNILCAYSGIPNIDLIRFTKSDHRVAILP